MAEEIHDLVQRITDTVSLHCTTLLTRRGIGPDNAAALLIAAGDNPDRLRSEASFAALCGVNPQQASSGKTTRHRLNRGSDQQANSALYRIALSRLRWDTRNRDYANPVPARTHLQIHLTNVHTRTPLNQTLHPNHHPPSPPTSGGRPRRPQAQGR